MGRRREAPAKTWNMLSKQAESSLAAGLKASRSSESATAAEVLMNHAGRGHWFPGFRMALQRDQSLPRKYDVNGELRWQEEVGVWETQTFLHHFLKYRQKPLAIRGIG